MSSLGRVYLVGAGPGDPGLLTLRGRDLLSAADAVVYDRLVDQRVLDHAGTGARLIDVGKVPGKEANRQDDINRLLVELAYEGLQVVRLKGGDPFVFGRGAEEAQALRDAGVPFEVVPGISSAMAAPAYAGIPITHRGVASSFTVVTGSEAPGKAHSAVRWDHLAQSGGTLVVLMGSESLDSIAEALVRHGRGPETPVALVRWGTRPQQETVTGTLADIAGKAQEAGLKPPVVAVIGGVVDLRERLRWFDSQPLFGKRVLVTRTRRQAGALSYLLGSKGALPIEVPTIEVSRPDEHTGLDAALAALDQQDWIVFTSANAVDAVWERLQAAGRDSRALHPVKVGAIGPATATRLGDIGIAADLVPDAFRSDAIVSAFRKVVRPGLRILLPRADIAPESLGDDLEAIGAVVTNVTAYKTVQPEGARLLLESVLREGFDVATFTSSSTVSNLCALLGGKVEPLSRATVACIGPVTAATARDLGVTVDIVAEEHTIPGLVAALETYYSRLART